MIIKDRHNAKFMRSVHKYFIAWLLGCASFTVLHIYFDGWPAPHTINSVMQDFYSAKDRAEDMLMTLSSSMPRLSATM